VIERCVVLSKGGTVHTRDLAIDAPQNGTPLRSAPLEGGAQTLDSMEEQLIRRVLEDNKWQKARSAEILGINRTTLWHKIKRYGLEKPCAPG
jgi:DNA-binding NtrC family response regulator